MFGSTSERLSHVVTRSMTAIMVRALLCRLPDFSARARQLSACLRHSQEHAGRQVQSKLESLLAQAAAAASSVTSTGAAGSGAAAHAARGQAEGQGTAATRGKDLEVTCSLVDACSSCALCPAQAQASGNPSIPLLDLYSALPTDEPGLPQRLAVSIAGRPLTSLPLPCRFSQPL